ncbi:hypothetical protein BATDEDRAFT_24481 [Batrachochytrium dendrobatidis JAM81]|uniref:Sec1 family protein n=1 Tax=Batrachochytrium dendrobatidis (strain JAM81 / FGSC 10211) TaxID=684364 RepID=F4P106_BATDJ|nr:tethering complex ATP-binding subunit VPS33 [Batrachochytrium dendrobatidis JAM81]EGF80675.1 hypothetical protein BATDEDRAFT_24481 [Batrachochytrium dendrobatidis JAM81]|eukprot:XP_006678464.1 hypothetical protein BATDEDRAFT_24481 [Batrachochytrium dendrobatidis JAM81]
MTAASTSNAQTFGLGPTSFSTAALREVSRRELIQVLDSVRGKKALVIDPSVSGPLSLVAEFAVLKEHGVEKIFHLASAPLETDCKSLVYITRPNPTHMKWIADQYKWCASQRSSTPDNQPDITVYFVPRRTLICDQILEEQGIFGDIAIGDYHLDIVPLEEDLLSLELDSFKPFYVDGDPTLIHSVAHAIMKFQILYGSIPRILGKGNGAKVLTELLIRMRRDYSIADAPLNSSQASDSEFDSIIILDRTVDLVSPLRVQLTYEGLIDELFSIKTTFVEISAPVSQVSPAAIIPPTYSKSKKLVLNNQDHVFSEIRNLGFEVVGSMLSHVALRIQEEEDERHKLKTTTQLKDFASKIGSLQQQRQSLGLHNGIYDDILRYAGNPDTVKRWAAEEVFTHGKSSSSDLEYIEELIGRQAPIETVLRLLCLYCVVNGGLKTKYYDSFRRHIVQTYGYMHIVTLQRLKQASLLFPLVSTGPKAPYLQLIKQLQLTCDYDSDQVADISYVYHGYAPISIRLIQMACRILNNTSDTISSAPSWKGCEDVLKIIPGPSIEETITASDRSFRKKVQQISPLTLVVFLGGCTMAEVAALRFISGGDSSQRGFIILTTGITTGSRLLNSMVSKPNATGSCAPVFSTLKNTTD